jgi:FkbM family methyltransferase
MAAQQARTGAYALPKTRFYRYAFAGWFILKVKQLIKSAFEALGYRVQGTRYTPRQLLDPNGVRPLSFDDVVCRHMFEVGQLTFIQVGVFDGVTHDPLRKYIERCGWRGVMIEPQPKQAEQVRALYAGSDRIVVLQTALDDQRGQRPFFVVESHHPWAGGLASFQRGTIAKHADLVPGLEATIREVLVDCVPFDDVLARLPGAQLDLLQVDTEGADAHILSLFPFERIQPAIVHWEIKHLSIKEREKTMARLASFGYRFAPSGAEDMLAVNF